jgi:phospho-N-acetylmuramoyl-pentapeptide-transferase
MLYHLVEWLTSLGIDIPGQAMMHTLSFRAMMASVTSMIFALVAGKKIIAALQYKQIGETIRDLGLEGQMQKAGTPTMGGVIIILSILCGVLLFANLTSHYIILLLVTTVWLGALGFADDYVKVFKKNKEGISERAKLIAQVALGLAVAITVFVTNDVNGTTTTIPFVKAHEFDYGWLSPFSGSFGDICKWAIYMIMIVIVITACSNGTNLTDGMDGLATGTSAIVGVVLGVFAWLSGNVVNTEYLNIMFISGSGEIAVFMAAFVGALIGFLWYNSFPAQVFMGDTGSLALGGIIGVTAVLVRKELLIPVLCGIFFVEALSVIMQRTYFKYTKKKYGQGKRIFKMAPLHHHFQKEGIPSLIQFPRKALPEAKIVVRFWIIGIILAVLTLALLKVR